MHKELERQQKLVRMALRILRWKELDDDQMTDLCEALVIRSETRLRRITREVGLED
jgi:hypothetical protein